MLLAAFIGTGSSFLAFAVLAYLVAANKERALQMAPVYQESLLAAIQRIAVVLGIESEPTWATLRHDMEVEEITEAALLHDLAEILLWCFAPRFALQIRDLQNNDATLRSTAALGPGNKRGMEGGDTCPRVSRAEHLVLRSAATLATSPPAGSVKSE